jgi:hypothetical protein
MGMTEEVWLVSVDGVSDMQALLMGQALIPSGLNVFPVSAGLSCSVYK